MTLLWNWWTNSNFEFKADVIVKNDGVCISEQREITNQLVSFVSNAGGTSKHPKYTQEYLNKEVGFFVSLVFSCFGFNIENGLKRGKAGSKKTSFISRLCNNPDGMTFPAA